MYTTATTSSPLVTPASSPPARLVRRRSLPSAPLSISSCAVEPGPREASIAPPSSTAFTAGTESRAWPEAAVELAVPRGVGLRGRPARPAPRRGWSRRASRRAASPRPPRRPSAFRARRRPRAAANPRAPSRARRTSAGTPAIRHGAERENAAADLDPARPQEQLADGAGGHPRHRLARGGALQDVAQVLRPDFMPPARSAWPGRGRVTRRFAAAASGRPGAGPSRLPVGEVAVEDADRDGGARA